MAKVIGGVIVIWGMFTVLMAGIVAGTYWVVSMSSVFYSLAAFWLVVSLLVAWCGVIGSVMQYMIDGDGPIKSFIIK